MDNYEKIKVIGRGAFGICYLCENKRRESRKKCVVKIVPLDCRSEDEKKAITSEAVLLEKLAHPNIIALYEHFISDDCFHMVMQFAEGGTMEQLIKDQKGIPISQDTVLYYFTQVSIALDYIHSKKILHRDLKTQNILLNRKRTIVKLSDFGISKQMLTAGVLSTMIGTPNYN